MNEKTDRDRNTATDANVESDSGDAALRANEIEALSSPCRVTFHHTRNRLADIDGLSGKAVLDGIVHAGILADDKAQQVAEVRHRQSKGKIETTTIVIEEIE